MPHSKVLLDAGIRAERAGDLDYALQSYSKAAGSVDPGVKAEALMRIADVHRERCAWEDAISNARAAQEIARAAGLDVRLAEATVAEANVYVTRGEFARAMPIFEEIVRTTADARLRGIALQNIGSMLAQLGQHDAAGAAFSDSLANFQQVGYARGEAMTLNNLGRLALDRHDPATAEPLLARAITAAVNVADSEMVAIASQNMALALSALGDPHRAEDLATQALGYFTSCSNHWRALECLRMLGALNERQGRLVDARRCYERALRLAEQIESEVEIRVTRHKLDALGGR